MWFYLIKIIWALSAMISGLAGLVALLIPLLPQWPFFLPCLFFAFKFSPRFHSWCLHTKLIQWFFSTKIYRRFFHRAFAKAEIKLFHKDISSLVYKDKKANR